MRNRTRDTVWVGLMSIFFKFCPRSSLHSEQVAGKCCGLSTPRRTCGRNRKPHRINLGLSRSTQAKLTPLVSLLSLFHGPTCQLGPQKNIFPEEGAVIYFNSALPPRCLPPSPEREVFAPMIICDQLLDF